MTVNTRAAINITGERAYNHKTLSVKTSIKIWVPLQLPPLRCRDAMLYYRPLYAHIMIT